MYYVATIVDSNRTNDVVGKPFLSDRRCAVTGIMHQSHNFTNNEIDKCHKLEYPTLFCCCCCFPIVGFFFWMRGLYTYNNADLQELDVEASAITGGQGGGAAAAGGGALKAR
ncbi:hypothetical protein ACJX0J_011090 [Zea mays]